MDQVLGSEDNARGQGQRHGTYRLHLAIVTVNLLSFTIGTSYSWTSPVLPKLTANNTQHFMDTGSNKSISSNQVSWLVSLLNLGGMVGPYLGCLCANKIGRKGSLLVFSSPIFIAHGLLAFTKSLYAFYAARFLLGIGVGASFSLVPMYVGEIAPTPRRGYFGCFMAIFVKLGLLFCYIVGPMTSIVNLTLACMLPMLLFLVLFPWLCPESPYYQLENNQKLEASTTLSILGCSSIDKELEAIALFISSAKSSSESSCDTNLWRTLSFRIGLCLWMLQQLSGITVVLSYMQSIFAATTSRSAIASIAVGLIQLLTTVVTSHLVDRLGRKLLLMLSFIGSATSLLMLGFYFHFGITVTIYMPIVLVVSYIITYNIGIGPIPWVLMGELFAPQIKTKASAICCSTGLFMAFLVTLLYPHLTTMFGIEINFIVFGCFCTIGAIFTWCVVRETKGKTLAQIQHIFLQHETTQV